MKLTRAKLESLVDDLIQKTIKPVESCLKDAKLDAHDIDEVIMVGGMTRMPKVVETVKNFFGKDLNQSVNPDEVVAIGAAIQGGVLGGEVKDILLLDVTPLTLAIETMGNIATPMIPRNTTVPTSKTETFSTASDNQTQVQIVVTQGERPMSADNKTLGTFVLDGIPPAPRGVPQVEVTFDMDASGILTVTAKDKATGKTQNIKITGAVGLSDDEIKRMQEEAEKHKEEDEKKAETIKSKNTADSMVATAEKSIKDAGDKVPADVKEKVEEKIKKVKEVAGKEDSSKEDIETATKELSEELSKIGEAMYKDQGAKTDDGSQKTEGENGGKKSEDGKKDDAKVEEGEVSVDITGLEDLVKGAGLDDEHLQVEEPLGTIVESYLSPVDMQVSGHEVKKGAWLLGVRWTPEMFAKIKAGARTGLSLYGRADSVQEEGV